MTRYEYDRGHHVQPAVNCGWLARANQFQTGEVELSILDALERLCFKRVHEARGFHDCDLCDEGVARPVADCGARVMTLGSAEIRVFHPDGTIFASPNLIVHYIRRHNYCPPGKFLEAVQWTAAHPDQFDARLVDYEQDTRRSSDGLAAMLEAIERGRRQK